MFRNHVSRRDFLRLALVGTGAAALAGCQAAVVPTQQTGSATGAVAAEAMTLDWWIVWGEDVFGDACRQIAGLYHEANPNVEVKVGLGASGSVEKIMTAVAGGVPPDITELGPVGELAMRKALVPLDELIAASGIDLNDIWEASIKRGSWAGQIYWLPFQADYTSALMWDKEIFQQAGLDPEQPPTSWEEMRAYSDQATQQDDSGNVTQIGLRPLDGIGVFAGTWCHAAGGTLYDEENLKYNLDTPEMADAVNYILGYYQQYGVENLAAFSTNVGGWQGADSAFNRRVQAMLINGSWAPGVQLDVAPEQKVGYTFLPTKTGKKVQLIGGHGNGIPTAVKAPDASWDFMHFVNSQTGAEVLWDIAKAHPPAKSWVATLDPSGVPGLEWFLQHAYNDADEQGYLQETLPLHDLMNSHFGSMIEEIAAGQKQVAEALAEWQSIVDTAFEEAKQAA